MKKKYTTPTLNIILMPSLQILTASIYTYTHRCSPSCRFWHFCRDRDVTGLKECSDFKFII